MPLEQKRRTWRIDHDNPNVATAACDSSQHDCGSGLAQEESLRGEGRSGAEETRARKMSANARIALLAASARAVGTLS